MTDPQVPRWKHDGVRVVPGDQLDSNTAQTPGMDRKAAINFARVGAQKIWAGTVHIPRASACKPSGKVTGDMFRPWSARSCNRR